MDQMAYACAPNRDRRFDVLNRWTILMNQGFEAKTFLDLAESFHIDGESSLTDLLTQHAFFRSFLLAYGKCFASSGSGRSSLDPNKVFAAGGHAKESHERIMILRHKFAAHNDASGLDDAAIEVRELEHEFLISHRYALVNPLHEYMQYRQALEELEIYIVDQVNRLIASLERKLQKGIRVVNSA